mgnify:CR=1 FL=1
MTISINSKYDLVAERYAIGSESEIIIMIREKETGSIHQDICLARVSDTKRETIEVLVWGDDEQEDYTDKFQIKLWNGEE